MVQDHYRSNEIERLPQSLLKTLKTENFLYNLKVSVLKSKINIITYLWIVVPIENLGFSMIFLGNKFFKLITISY